MTKSSIELTKKRFDSILKYDRRTGIFTWLVSRGKARAGSQAGVLNTDGYRVIRIDGTLYYAHRLAIFCCTGKWPEFDTDHRNGRRDDNRLRNIRVATRSQNNENRAGIKGYTKTPSGKYQAQIQSGGKHIKLGTFDCPDTAHAAYLSAKNELHTFQPTPRQ